MVISVGLCSPPSSLVLRPGRCGLFYILEPFGARGQSGLGKHLDFLQNYIKGVAPCWRWEVKALGVVPAVKSNRLITLVNSREGCL